MLDQFSLWKTGLFCYIGWMNEQVEKKEIPEILLIDKPKGITSFDVIRILRKKLGVRKMGHSGTLDPLASGLLVLGIGTGTKKLAEFIKLDKVYEAYVLLGKQTATGDMEGKILREIKTPDFSEEEINEVLEKIVGVIKLPVPAYSAIKKEGVTLYSIARAGGTVEVPIKEMFVYWVKLLGHSREGDNYILHIELKVKSGTYIRSISEEIGRLLNIPATIKDLRRLSVGDFLVKEADTI